MASFISFTNIIQLILIGKGRGQLLISYRSNRSAQPTPRKNLSTSILIFSSLLFVYQSYSNQRSTGKQGSPSASLAARLLYFNIRYSPLLYSLVGSKVISLRNRHQLFLPSFRIVFLSLFLRALKLYQQQASPITLYYRLALLAPVSSQAASSDYSRRACLLGQAFRQYSSRQLLIILQISSSDT